MRDSRLRQKPIRNRAETFPTACDAAEAPTAMRGPPPAEASAALEVSRHRVIVEICAFPVVPPVVSSGSRLPAVFRLTVNRFLFRVYPMKEDRQELA
jgi:hypothetical protein